MKIKGFGHNLVKGVKDNASTILTCVSLIGLVGTVIFTAKAAPKVKDRLDERDEDLRDLYVRSKDMTEEEFKKEEKEIKKDAMKDIVKECSKPGACAVVCAFGTIAAQVTNLGSIGTLSGALVAANSRKDVLEKKVKDVVGESKLTKIKDEIANDSLDKALQERGHVDIVNTGYGSDLFYDDLSGQFFICSLDALEKMELRFNQELLKEYTSYYDKDSALSFKQDAIPWYKYYIGLDISDAKAKSVSWDGVHILELIYTYKDNVLINGEYRKVTIITLGNTIEESKKKVQTAIKNHNNVVAEA